jgi:hypothetical protein
MPAGVLTLDGLLAIVEQTEPSSSVFRGAAEILDSYLLPSDRRGAAPTPRGPQRLLTIAIATFNDYDGVFFSAQALRLYHPEITSETEILVIDNDPQGPCASALKSLEGRIAGYRYYPYDSFHGTTVKDLLFREASGEFVLVMDSHVLFPPGSLARFVEFLQCQKHSNDLWQGPLLSDALKPLATHFDSVWSEGMHGQWGWDERASGVDAPPFEIPMQGMGVFACRKAAWPGFNPRFQGFCCEEGYIHEKVRRNGGVPLCLPFLRWLHRFERPGGVPYRPIWADRIRNYLIGYDELQMDPRAVVEHFETLLGSEAKPLIEAAKREIAGPYNSYDAVFAIDGDPLACERHIGTRVRRITAPRIAWHPEIGRVMAHRSIVAEAVWQGLRKILVVEGQPASGQAYCFDAFESFLRHVPESPARIALWLKQQGDLKAFGRPIGIN